MRQYYAFWCRQQLFIHSKYKSVTKRSGPAQCQMAWWIAILITGSLKSASKLNIHQLCNSNSLPHTTFRVWPNMILIGWLVQVVRVYFISIYFIFESTSTKHHGSLLMRVLTSDRRHSDYFSILSYKWFGPICTNFDSYYNDILIMWISLKGKFFPVQKITLK